MINAPESISIQKSVEDTKISTLYVNQSIYNSLGVNLNSKLHHIANMAKQGFFWTQNFNPWEGGGGVEGRMNKTLVLSLW